MIGREPAGGDSGSRRIMAKAIFGRAVVTGLCLGAAIFGLAAVDPGPSPPDSDTPSTDPPRGQLLIASARIQDPRFYHAVVLLLRHDKTGAFGIVVNHPLADEAVA